MAAHTSLALAATSLGAWAAYPLISVSRICLVPSRTYSPSLAGERQGFWCSLDPSQTLLLTHIHTLLLSHIYAQWDEREVSVSEITVLCVFLPVRQTHETFGRRPSLFWLPSPPVPTALLSLGLLKPSCQSFPADYKPMQPQATISSKHQFYNFVIQLVVTVCIHRGQRLNNRRLNNGRCRNKDSQTWLTAVALCSDRL